jgi:hypothetical protein
VALKMKADPLDVLNETSNQSDFFQNLFEPRMSKTIAMIISALSSLTAITLIYSIIWFEHYGSDGKRTIQVFPQNFK